MLWVGGVQCWATGDMECTCGNESVFCTLRGYNAWSQLVSLFKEVYHFWRNMSLEVDFESLNLSATSSSPSLLPACSWRCELSFLSLPSSMPTLYHDGVLSLCNCKLEKAFFCKWLHIIMFYHSNRKVTNTDLGSVPGPQNIGTSQPTAARAVKQETGIRANFPV